MRMKNYVFVHRYVIPVANNDGLLAQSSSTIELNLNRLPTPWCAFPSTSLPPPPLPHPRVPYPAPSPSITIIIDKREMLKSKAEMDPTMRVYSLVMLINRSSSNTEEERWTSTGGALTI